MSRRTPDIDIPDLSGQRAVVTGASDGMGMVMAAKLARAGAELVLPVRNRRKGDAAIEKITRQVPGAKVSLRDLDLSSLETAANMGAQLRDEGVPIAMLILNAGVMTPPDRQTTQDGFELQWGANHLGHFAVVGHLLPLLIAGKARVTSQVSVAANQGAINWDDLNWERSYSGMKAYSQSKIAFGLFGLELDRRSKEHGWGIVSNISHPGVAPTNLLAARPEVGRDRDTFGRRIISFLSSNGILLGTVESAALPALYAATSPSARGGAFYGPAGLGHLGGPPGEQKLYSRLTSADEAARVWAVSEKLTGVTIS